jgi:hypothetical protein
LENAGGLTQGYKIIMREPTKGFAEKVEKGWGNPVRVAEVGIDEMFNHETGLFGFNHEDQVEMATRIGVMAGQTAEKRPNAFIEAYTAYLNEN